MWGKTFFKRLVQLLKYFAGGKIKLMETDLSVPLTFGYESLQKEIFFQQVQY